MENEKTPLAELVEFCRMHSPPHSETTEKLATGVFRSRKSHNFCRETRNGFRLSSSTDVNCGLHFHNYEERTELLNRCEYDCLYYD